MIDHLTMKFIYKKLKRLGFDKKYIRHQVLPSWWDDELNEKPVAVLEGAGYIASNLNIDLLSKLIWHCSNTDFPKQDSENCKTHN
jgi:hypothetical protein